MWFLLGVSEGVINQIAFLAKRFAVASALVRFLSGVNKGVPFKITILNKTRVTLWALVLRNPTVDLLVLEKVPSFCKCFRTQFSFSFLRFIS